MDDSQKTMSNDITSAARAGASAARTAISVGKAAGKAAAGDVAGAAIELAKDENIRKIILVIVCISFFLNVVIFFAVPLALYEGIIGISQVIAEKWEEVKYSYNDGNFFSACSAIFNGSIDTLKEIGGAIANIWNSVFASQTKNDEVDTDKDPLTDNDMKVLGDDSSSKEVYEKKITACINKFDARAGQIEKSITASASGSRTDTSTINGYIYQNLFLLEKERLESLEDTGTVSYGGVEASISKIGLSKREAVNLIALYSTLYNTSDSNVKPYALLKWLGYYDNGEGEAISFTVGNAVSCSVPAWKGDFMPAYLVQESLDNPDGDYERYKAPATDVMLMVSSVDFDNMEPVIQKEERIIEEVQPGSGGYWKAMTEKQANRLGLMYEYRDDMPARTPEMYQRNQYWYWIVQDEVVETVKYDYTLSYSFTCNISVRSTDAITKLAGLYEKNSKGGANNE